jgi:hypothetical protein
MLYQNWWHASLMTLVSEFSAMRQNKPEKIGIGLIENKIRTERRQIRGSRERTCPWECKYLRPRRISRTRDANPPVLSCRSGCRPSGTPFPLYWAGVFRSSFFLLGTDLFTPKLGESSKKFAHGQAPIDRKRDQTIWRPTTGVAMIQSTPTGSRRRSTPI